MSLTPEHYSNINNSLNYNTKLAKCYSLYYASNLGCKILNKMIEIGMSDSIPA